MRAAGAQLIYVSHENFPYHDCSTNNNIEKKVDEDEEEERVRFETYLQSIYQEGIHTACMQIFSAHQMSSCKMAAHPYDGPTSPTGLIDIYYRIYHTIVSIY